MGHQQADNLSTTVTRHTDEALCGFQSAEQKQHMFNSFFVSQ
jgi:hypothetical protein